MTTLNITPGHYGDNGPVAAATEFFDAACASDFTRCWATWSTDLHRTAAEHWVDTNLAELQQAQPRQRDEFVEMIANATDPATLTGSDSELWESFEDTQLHSMTTAWADFIELHAAGRLGAGSTTRLLSPGRERVILTETDPTNPTVYTEATQVPAITVDIEWDGHRWLIVNID